MKEVKCQDKSEVPQKKWQSKVAYFDFYVRKSKVYKALCYLKKCNPFYTEVQIDEENLKALPDNNLIQELVELSVSSNQKNGEKEKGDTENKGKEEEVVMQIEESKKQFNLNDFYQTGLDTIKESYDFEFSKLDSASTSQ